MAVWQTSIACMSNREIKIAVGRTLGTIAPPEENYQNPTLRYTTVNRRVSVISNHSTTAHTLQICDIITYNGDVDESSAYRVKSFLKQWVPPALTDEEQSIMDLLNIDNNNREDEALPARIALVRCHPKEAQFVSAIGTCGIIAPITHVTRVGCVDWDDNTINEERERYAKLDTGKAKNFLAYIDDRWGFLNK